MMNLTLDSGGRLKRYLIAGILALALVLGPAAGMASAEPAKHECREHGKKSQECREHRAHGKKGGGKKGGGERDD